MPSALTLHPDRALPADPQLRAIARTVYAATKDLPLVCMHGHVDAAVLADDAPFADPAALLITPDHYVTRMLASPGGAARGPRRPAPDGGPVETDARAIWRTFCAHWHLFRGTPVALLAGARARRGLRRGPAPSAPDRGRALRPIVGPARRARSSGRGALLDRFGIELISTTDPASCPTWPSTRRLADHGLGARVVPTFRPDALVHLDPRRLAARRERARRAGRAWTPALRRVPRRPAPAPAGVHRRRRAWPPTTAT